MKNEIWRWFDGLFKVHCEKAEVYHKIMRWPKSIAGGVYLMPSGPREYDVIIPEEYLDRVKQLLGLNGRSRSRKVCANPGLNDNELRQVESPQSDVR